jgi:uncharacterized Zn-binding protein involved in type VI secretion
MFANTQRAGTDFSFADTLLTPMPAPVPIPYVNTAQGSIAVDAVPNVLIQGMPAHNMGTTVPVSDGDNPGIAGVSSGTVRGVSRPVTGANTVLIGGMPATRLTTQNSQNTTNASGARISPSQTKVLLLAP